MDSKCLGEPEIRPRGKCIAILCVLKPIPILTRRMTYPACIECHQAVDKTWIEDVEQNSGTNAYHKPSRSSSLEFLWYQVFLSKAMFSFRNGVRSYIKTSFLPLPLLAPPYTSTRYPNHINLYFTNSHPKQTIQTSQTTYNMAGEIRHIVSMSLWSSRAITDISRSFATPRRMLLRMLYNFHPFESETDLE